MVHAPSAWERVVIRRTDCTDGLDLIQKFLKHFIRQTTARATVSRVATVVQISTRPNSRNSAICSRNTVAASGP